MAKTSVGIYVGVNAIAAVVTQGKKIISFGKQSLSSLDEEPGIETFDENIRLEALINKTLREAGTDSRSVFVSINDKEFFLRSFELPSMSKKEVEVSVGFEAEKHIPFSINDVTWDCIYARKRTDKNLIVSFIGMRDPIHARYQSIFEHLDLSVLLMEFSSFSLARLVCSLKQFSKRENFALLDFSEKESYITFYYNKLPIFSRYLTVPVRDGVIEAGKFNEQIRISWEYFKREFKLYEVENLAVVCDPTNASLFSDLKDDLGVEVDIILPEELTGSRDLEVEHLKAYAAATLHQYHFPFRIALKKPSEELEKEVARPLPPINKSLIGVVSVIGVLGLFFLYLVMSNRVSVETLALNKKEAEMSVPAYLQDKSFVDLEKLFFENGNVIRAMDERRSSLRKLFPVLDPLSEQGEESLLRNGLWLERIVYIQERGSTSFDIFGYAFLNDPEEERQSVNQFLDELKSQERFNQTFSRIDLIYREERDLGDYVATSFNIRLE